MAGETWTDTPVPGKPWSNHVLISGGVTYTIVPEDSAATTWLSPDGEFVGTLADAKTYVEDQIAALEAAQAVLTIEVKVIAETFEYEDYTQPIDGGSYAIEQAFAGDIIFMIEPQAVAIVDAETAAGINDGSNIGNFTDEELLAGLNQDGRTIELIGTPTI